MDITNHTTADRTYPLAPLLEACLRMHPVSFDYKKSHIFHDAAAMCASLPVTVENALMCSKIAFDQASTSGNLTDRFTHPTELRISLEDAFLACGNHETNTMIGKDLSGSSLRLFRQSRR